MKKRLSLRVRQFLSASVSNCFFLFVFFLNLLYFSTIKKNQKERKITIL